MYIYHFKIGYCCVLLLLVNSLSSQTTANPFDLVHRRHIETPAPTDSATQSAIQTSALEKPVNPFDIAAEPIEKANKITPTKKNQTTSQKDLDNNNPGFLFWVLLTVLLIFTSVFRISRDRISKMYHSFLNENFMRQTHRMNQGRFSFIYLILYVFAFVNLGIFTFLSLQSFDINTPSTFQMLLLMIGLFALILLIKHILLALVGYIFPVDKEISLYSFTIMVFWTLIGIFLLPINIIIAYAPDVVGKFVVYGAVGAIIATYLFRAIRGFSIGSKYLMSNTFHFFIYLCTVEILPVVVLLKLIQSYAKVTL